MDLVLLRADFDELTRRGSMIVSLSPRLRMEVPNPSKPKEVGAIEIGHHDPTLTCQGLHLVSVSMSALTLVSALITSSSMPSLLKYGSLAARCANCSVPS